MEAASIHPHIKLQGGVRSLDSNVIIKCALRRLAVSINLPKIPSPLLIIPPVISVASLEELGPRRNYKKPRSKVPNVESKVHKERVYFRASMHSPAERLRGQRACAQAGGAAAPHAEQTTAKV